MKSDEKRLVVVLSCALVSGCGGGGGGGSASGPTPPAPTVKYVSVCVSGAVANSTLSQDDADSKCPVKVSLAGTGVEGVPGSVCTWYNGMLDGNYPRIVDLDGKGYVSWASGRVRCATPDGPVEDISGLALSAFKFTGNGVTAASPEDVVEGQAASDQHPTYTIQNYRSFASSAGVTTANEDVEIGGTDSKGRMIRARGKAFAARYFWDISDPAPGGATAGSRVFDADGQGYTATTWLVVNQKQRLSTSSPCPIGSGVKEFDTNESRNCLYTALKDFYYAGGAGSTYRTWALQYGTVNETLPLAMERTAVDPVLATSSGARIPIYKMKTTVRYPTRPVQGWLAGDHGIGWLYVDLPAQNVTGLLLSNVAPIGFPD